VYRLESVGGGLRKNPGESQFSDGTGRKQERLFCLGHPGNNPAVEFVLLESQGHKSIHIEQVGHGKSARISRTSLLVNTGACGPALRTGNQVTGSVTIFVL